MINLIKSRRFGGVLAVMAALIVILAVTLPWKPWIETRLKTFLEVQGFQNPQLTVSYIGLTGIVLKDVAVGGDMPLHLNQISLGYSAATLLGGRLHEINIAGLTLEIRKDDENWNFSGIEKKPATPPSDRRRAIPVTSQALAVIPFDTAKLEDSRLRIVSERWQLDIPVQLSWRKEPTPELTYEAKGLALKAASVALSTGAATLKTMLNEGERVWNGEWDINDVKMTGIGPDVPLMTGEGTLAAKEDELMIQGQLASADKAYRSNFRVDYFLNEPAKSRLEIVDTALPWNGGTVSAANVLVPFEDKRSVSLNLRVQSVSLSALLQQLTGKETAAAGAISGTLPVTIGADGTIAVQAGKLAAEGPGVIAMAPDTIPGDNEQVDVARNILKNFHYTTLSIGVDQDKDNKLSVLMTLEGSNPDVYAGRAAKLNVHLSGDVLNFIQQNLLILTNHQKLLRQGNDAKP